MESATMEPSKGDGKVNGLPPIVQSEDQEMAPGSSHSESSRKRKFDESGGVGVKQKTRSDIAQTHTDDPKTIMDTFDSVLAMLRGTYLGVNLCADEREKTVTLVNYIVNDGQLNAEDEKSTSVKALRDIVDQNSLDSLLRLLKKSGDGGMAKLRQQLAIIWKLFLRMNTADKERARTLLNGFFKEDFSSVPRLPMELLMKIVFYVTSFAGRVRLAATCRLLRSTIIDSIRQTPERVMMIDMDQSFTIVNGVRVPNTRLHPTHRGPRCMDCVRALTDCIGALVAFAQPTTLLVRPLQRWPCTAFRLRNRAEDYSLATSGMVALTAGVQAPALSSSTTVHLCCRSLEQDNSVDLLAQLDKVSLARITSVCCADYHHVYPKYRQLLPILPNCRKIFLEATCRDHWHIPTALNKIGNGALAVRCPVDVLTEWPRVKKLELHIRLDHGGLLHALQNQPNHTFARDSTSIHVKFDSSRYCSFDCTDLLQHRL